ncbi:MAG: uroporphyrinogen decarboxylase [Eubacteriales bacterium]
MREIIELKKERQKLFEDLYHLRQPKRVPITIKVNNDFGIQYAGMDLVDTQWYPEKMELAAEAICQDFFADRFPFGSRRFAAFYMLTNSNYFRMSSAGFLQHPEIVPMKVDEYKELNNNPYDFLVEKILPRLYPAFNVDASHKAYSFSIGMQARADDNAVLSSISKKMTEKYGYFNPTAKGVVYAPYDFIADVLRGFTGVSMDIRRNPQQVIEACESVLPLMVKSGITNKHSVMSDTYLPLHMAPFMRQKDFEKFYWPTFKKMVEQIMATGQGMSFFCEQDWTRYLDYLQDLPSGIRLRFEYGDPKVFKEKLGKRHIISGFYPVSMFKSATVEECKDKAKELLDILAPGGNCSFDVDKVMATYEGGKEKYIEVFNLVKEYGRY